MHRDRPTSAPFMAAHPYEATLSRLDTPRLPRPRPYFLSVPRF